MFFLGPTTIDRSCWEGSPIRSIPLSSAEVSFVLSGRMGNGENRARGWGAGENGNGSTRGPHFLLQWSD